MGSDKTWRNGLCASAKQGVLMSNAFTKKPDIGAWLKREQFAQRSRINGQGGPKVQKAHIKINPNQKTFNRQIKEK